MSEQRFATIYLGNPYECVIKDHFEDKTYGTISGEEKAIKSLCGLLNEQQDQISYWKHKVNSLLWILSQFDEEKVKELLKELDDE